MSRPRLGLFSLRAVIFQGGLHQCPSEKGAKASRLLASTSRSLVTSRLTLPANAGLLRLLPPKTPVRETRRRREPDSNHRSRLFKAASGARIFVFLTCDSAGSEGAQIPSVNPSFRSDILSCRAAGQVRRLAGCRAVDGHSKLLVDCLVEPMCQTRAGESGSWFGIAP